MKPSVLAAAIASFLLGGAATFAITRWLGKGSPELMFVVGAVLGTQLAAVAHHRVPGATSSLGVKAAVGGMLAVAAVVLGIGMHLTYSPFSYVEVSVPIAVIGSFVFPFVLFGGMWKALCRRKDA